MLFYVMLRYVTLCYVMLCYVNDAYVGRVELHSRPRAYSPSCDARSKASNLIKIVMYDMLTLLTYSEVPLLSLTLYWPFMSYLHYHSPS